MAGSVASQQARVHARLIGSFIEGLRALGYAESTLPARVRDGTAFLQWLRDKRDVFADTDDAIVAAFLEETPARSKSRRVHERATARRVLAHVRAQDGALAAQAEVDPSSTGALERSYAKYLRSERGLAERSVEVYLPYVRGFLAAQSAADLTLDEVIPSAETVREFVIKRTRERSGSYCRLLVAALRSFLRFLFLRGKTECDLSPAIPRVQTWSLATVPAHLSAEQIEKILDVTDRATASGHRDHAILLLLARLGLRAGEVVALELDDIRWRTGEFIVRGKGRTLDRLPLPSDVGEALARYIQRDRGRSASRRVFLRTIPPRVALVGPASVGHVVRRAIARAGIQRSSRGAAHLLRHSLATRMIRHGASFAEIAEVLRHHAPGTTEIYAKVAFETLRGVARPWPAGGDK